MSIVIVYKCDHCGKEWEKNEKSKTLCTLFFSCSFGSTSREPFSEISKTQQWCRDCVMEAGIIPPTTKKDITLSPEKELSLEEKFLRIISDLGFVHKNEL